MYKILAVLLFFFAAGCASSSSPAVIGVYSASTPGSRLELIQGGDLALEEVGELKLWFPAGSWKIEDDRLILSIDDEVACYSVNGDKLHLIKKAGAAAAVKYADIALATDYSKEPILEGSDSPQRESGPRLNKP